MFEKTLSDLVKGVRANKRSEAEYISKCIQEIKEELASKDPNLLVEGILKLLYLNMLEQRAAAVVAEAVTRIGPRRSAVSAPFLASQ